MIWADNTRILAIFAVVFLHVAADVVTGVDSFNSSQWWIGNIYDSLVRWCVPVFVMLSGALLLSDEKVESIPVFYKKRANRLLIPILFWSLIFLALFILKGIVKGHAPSLSDIGDRLLSGSPYPHMWFLYMIMGLYLVTPFIRIIIKHTSNMELYYFIIVLFCLASTNMLYNKLYDTKQFFFIIRFLPYLPYFILGHLIAISRLELNKMLLIFIFVLSVLLTALGCFLLSKSYGLRAGIYFYNNLSITGIPMAISVMFLLKKMTTPIIVNAKYNSRFAGIVLGIYLVHPIIIELLKHYGIYAPSFNALISIPLISILVFIISAILAWFIHMTPYLRRTI